MHDTHDEVKRICELKKSLLCWAECEVAKGYDQANSTDLGAIVDMVKDLSEAENQCREAAYHKSITDAMEGYSPSRSRYTPGRDSIRMRWPEPDSYTEMSEPYRDERSRRNESLRDRDQEPKESRYGHTFDEYRRAKRHYTQTHAETDKKAMNDYASEHFMDTVATLREIWSDADVTLKQRMKADMTKLVGEMTV